MQVRADDQRRFIFLMNFTQQEQAVALTETLTEVINGIKVGEHINLPPFGVSVLAQDRAQA